MGFGWFISLDNEFSYWKNQNQISQHCNKIRVPSHLAWTWLDLTLGTRFRKFGITAVEVYLKEIHQVDWRPCNHGFCTVSNLQRIFVFPTTRKLNFNKFQVHKISFQTYTYWTLMRKWESNFLLCQSGSFFLHWWIWQKN